MNDFMSIIYIIISIVAVVLVGIFFNSAVTCDTYNSFSLLGR